ncbi:KN motif and ankyrin repeat domain-containing protein 4-like [Syngnathoides biaculeatus]|uniref:KN motif and ankyrin repeat domain-containing protein 4-like n=1 Tax=Syngnathoides biaculeatus TaxID=300417 RepID=UPI002ADDF1BC|nr:KN motif and ankyrin repeat domain-containing protein 4-like [Syngnathoides biaculeatus]XP_061694923.1 KN motif and ankyrin repeat domain-containing protein 4-like [Syngnathoides biaculeatus]
MTERHNGNTRASEASDSGQLPYSVETPYGFRLDLDFLKYVDDIEKGKTIKRIAIQRHGRGPRPNTLPRHLDPAGRSAWGSTGALGLRSRTSDEHRCGSASWLSDRRSPVSSRGRAELEAKIRAFDEQPLGEHIRPHLLRASSLPLTVLLRQGLETTEEAASLWRSRGHLEDRNKSCEDIAAHSPHGQDCSGLLRRLRDALEHVEELEKEVRIIPDLRAQICLLQEEKDTLHSHIQPLALNGTHDERRSRQAARSQDWNPAHEWRASTDLDELLTVTSLQAKVAMLEQKLHETELDLQRVAGRLRRQQKESESKNEHIEGLTADPGVTVGADRAPPDQEEDEIVAVPKSAGTNGESPHLGDEVADPRERWPPTEASADPSVALHHINKIKRLLDEQWACLSAAGQEEGVRHLSPKVVSLQRRMTALVDILRSRYARPGRATAGGEGHGTTDSGARTLEASEKGPKTTPCDHPVEQDRAPQTATSSESSGGPPRVTAQDGRGQTTAQAASVEGGAAAERAQVESQPPAEPTAGAAASDPGGDSMRVNADFMAACHFLDDHMDNIENPSTDTRKALVVLFQDWFSAAAEENSSARKVAVFLREVKRATPSLAAFLVNLADDHGNTVLHYSVSHRNYGIVGLLLDTGVSDVDFQNKAGYTAAMLASLTAPDDPGDMEVVRRLMGLGNVNVRSSQTGQTALHLAVRHGRVVMVRLLLSCGADGDVQDAQGTTALMFASQRGDTHVARLLLERTRCHLTLTDQSGRTALSIAMQGSHGDTVALLQAHAKARARK